MDSDWSLRRFGAFAQTLRKRDMTPATNAQAGHWPNWNDAQQNRPVRAFLRKLSGPAAIMACNDLMARVLADACAEMKLIIPDEIAIVGVDNSESLCESD